MCSVRKAMPAAPLAHCDAPVATRGGRASTSAGAMRAGASVQPMQLQPLHHALRSHAKGLCLQWGRYTSFGNCYLVCQDFKDILCAAEGSFWQSI